MFILRYFLQQIRKQKTEYCSLKIARWHCREKATYFTPHGTRFRSDGVHAHYYDQAMLEYFQYVTSLSSYQVRSHLEPVKNLIFLLNIQTYATKESPKTTAKHTNIVRNKTSGNFILFWKKSSSLKGSSSCQFFLMSTRFWTRKSGSWRAPEDFFNVPVRNVMAPLRALSQKLFLNGDSKRIRTGRLRDLKCALLWFYVSKGKIWLYITFTNRYRLCHLACYPLITFHHLNCDWLLLCLGQPTESLYRIENRRVQ